MDTPDFLLDFCWKVKTAALIIDFKTAVNFLFFYGHSITYSATTLFFITIVQRFSVFL